MALSTLKTVTAGDGPIQNDSVAHAYMAHAFSNMPYDAGALMSHDERTFPVQGGVVGVTNASGFNLDEDLTRFWSGYIDSVDNESSLAVGDGCFGLHGCTVAGDGGAGNAFAGRPSRI